MIFFSRLKISNKKEESHVNKEKFDFLFKLKAEEIKGKKNVIINVLAFFAAFGNSIGDVIEGAWCHCQKTEIDLYGYKDIEKVKKPREDRETVKETMRVSPNWFQD